MAYSSEHTVERWWQSLKGQGRWCDTKSLRKFIQRDHRRVALSLLSPLMYCWLNPDSSSTCSWVSPFSRRIRAKFRPTSRRISMPAGLADPNCGVYQL